jgi:hypothetical protein
MKPNGALKEKIMNDDEGKQEDEVKQKKDLIIPRNALFGIGPAVAITAVLLSKDKPAEVLLLFGLLKKINSEQFFQICCNTWRRRRSGVTPPSNVACSRFSPSREMRFFNEPTCGWKV